MVRGFHEKPALIELRRIRMIIRGTKALFMCCGRTTSKARNPAAMKNTTMNHISQSFFNNKLIKQSIIKGLSHNMFRFHFI
jgi:hypothetical protein